MRRDQKCGCHCHWDWEWLDFGGTRISPTDIDALVERATTARDGLELWQRVRGVSFAEALREMAA